MADVNSAVITLVCRIEKWLFEIKKRIDTISIMNLSNGADRLLMIMMMMVRILSLKADVTASINRH